MGKLALLLAMFFGISGCVSTPDSQTVLDPETESAPSAESQLSPEKPLSRAEISAAESEKGERAYKKENYGSAERHFRLALRLMPSNLHALSGLAWTLYDSGRPDEAYPYFERAQALYPSDDSTRRGLAYLLYRYGKTEKAKELLGSLDKERWPELANIDDELNLRREQGLPPPKPPVRNLKGLIPGIIKEVFQEKPDEKRENSKTEASIPGGGKKETPGKETATSRYSQQPTFQTMVLIPGGFLSNGKGPKLEVRSFRIDKFEVTNALYAAFVQAKKMPEPPFWDRSRFSGPHLPVVGVTWDEARAYCHWAGKRLPTEAEWEYAAAGGPERRQYPWGNKFETRNAVFGLPPDRGAPKGVGRRPDGATVYGAEDMSGNVWEWVEDPFYAKPRDSEPVVRDGVTLRALRGGSWINGRWSMTVDSRTGDLPDRRLPVYGFRCAADAP